MLSHTTSYCTDLNTFVAKDEFNEYPFYEVYNVNKTYTCEPFKHDYGFGEHTYKYTRRTILSNNLSNNLEISDTNKLEYIVVEDDPTPEELQLLIPHCQCVKCAGNWYDLTKYVACGCCIGCLRSAFPQQYQINRARKYQAFN
jgi:hypothetical protein